MVTRLLPGLRQFRGYRRSWLRADVVAGVTVAAYLIPQVMAYATVAGLPPVAGLWAAIAPLAVYVLWGTSRQLSVGPESTTALLTAVALAPLAGGDPRRYAALAALLALLVGALCLLGALIRLGVLADLLSHPVLVGYLAGTAGLMIVGQSGRVTGVPVEGDTVLAQVRSLVTNIDQWHPATALLAGSVLVALLAMARWLPRAPGPLIAVLAAAAAVSALSLQRFGIAVVGSVPTGLPVPGLPEFEFADVSALLLPAVGIAVVGFSDNALTGRAFAARHGDHVRPNAELAALGATNVATALTHGFPVSCSGSRTTIADLLGARSQLYALVTGATVLVVLFGATDVLAGFPVAALGALVVYAALRLIEVSEFARLARFRRSELLLAVGTVVAVLALGVLYGVLVAIALSVSDLLRRIAHAHDAVLGFVPHLAGMHDVDDYPDATRIAGLVIYRYDAPLCFANAEDFRKRALAAAESGGEELRWFVLSAEANVEVDLTALDAVEQVRAELSARGVVFAMARVKQDLRDDLDASGLTERIGPERLFPTLATAVAAFRAATAPPRSVVMDDHDRALGVLGQPVAGRPEEQTAETTTTPATDDEQLRGL